MVKIYMHFLLCELYINILNDLNKKSSLKLSTIATHLDKYIIKYREM